ncbi:hypothetical protein DOTSEDRAFT_70720 [Dothistroma septosporum NZE10]|uniref:Uncharacterized protein n=1 Tax=Dothistroma septosporum (strain NZE10 / CBS 128990) TaxID=675120 RepID=N1PX96_DOTSN|nr:hypothetical protein DOTSEDRAFT_70720 [Dothistroma septosporum NZE10]
MLLRSRYAIRAWSMNCGRTKLSNVPRARCSSSGSMKTSPTRWPLSQKVSTTSLTFFRRSRDCWTKGH